MAETIKTYSKSELAQLYNVSTRTFVTWIKPVLNTARRKLLTPKEVAEVYRFLGPPETETNEF